MPSFWRHINIALSVRCKSCLSDNVKTNESNLMKLHSKIKHTEKVCRAQELRPLVQGQGYSGVRGHVLKSCLRNNLQTAETLMICTER